MNSSISITIFESQHSSFVHKKKVLYITQLPDVDNILPCTSISSFLIKKKKTLIQALKPEEVYCFGGETKMNSGRTK